MRNFINIVENEEEDDDDFWRSYDEEHTQDPFVTEVRSTLEEHGGRASDQEINDVADNIRAKMVGGCEIYRVMRLPEEFIDQMRPGKELGQSWSVEPDFPTDNLYDSREHPNGVLFRFTAYADISDIELEHSVAFNILFPEEEEVFLRMSARIKFISVVEDGDDDNLRPDLVGQYMAA